jgi:hypothetical protein
MRIGISASILPTEYVAYYIAQLTREGHEIVLVSDHTREEIDSGATFEMCICSDLEKLVSLVGAVKHLLFFPESRNVHENCPQQIVNVGSWWEIYNHIRYEI